MVSYSDLTKLFAFDLAGKACIEIAFAINGHPKYSACQMGKTPDKTDRRKDQYWFGLVPDGSEAYSYDNFDDFSSAPVLDGKSLKESWNCVTVLSIDGCEPEERLPFYLSFVR